MATICYAFHLTPAEYRALTIEEEAAFHRFLKDLKREVDG